MSLSRIEAEKIVRDAVVKAVPYVKSTAHLSIGNNLRCFYCGELDNYENRNTCKNGAVRPIRLADILVAIDEHSNTHDIDISKLCGISADMPYQAMYFVGKIVDKWNCRQDSLSLQSDETVIWLASLFT